MSLGEHSAGQSSARKPRIALMGEFSAGKSTLSNLLLGARPLPEKVTATRLSPVWISHGTQAPYREDIDGSTEPVLIDRLEGIPVENTRCIRLFLNSDILALCDLIDFPGISDPNMSSDVWERMLPEVDAVIWCTHATQAWRQSEAAVWAMMPEIVREKSVLLITRFDKLTNDRDRLRVMKRVRRETESQFGAVFPIALLQAIAAGDNPELWRASGAGPFVEFLLGVIEELSDLVATGVPPLFSTGQPKPEVEPLVLMTEEPAPAPAAEPEPEAVVQPRRVVRPVRVTEGRRPRPAATTPRPVLD